MKRGTVFCFASVLHHFLLLKGFSRCRPLSEPVALSLKGREGTSVKPAAVGVVGAGTGEVVTNEDVNRVRRRTSFQHFSFPYFLMMLFSQP
jgi:hypothetical protein